MELEVQKYLRAGKTPADLEREFFISATGGEPHGLVALNYHQFLTPMEMPLARECRGLFLEPGTWNVASRSFAKFFNQGEPYAADLDWTTARVTEKLDGTLICIYHYRGEWRVGTRSRPDAGGNCHSHSFTFATLVRRTLDEIGTPWDRFVEALDPGRHYSFELVAPENRIVVPYAERGLVWLGCWDAATLRELSLWDLPDLPVPRVAQHPLRTAAEVRAAVEALHPFDGEGVVVSDAGFQRLKVKSPRYALVQRSMVHLQTDRQRLEYLLSGQLDDLWPLLPEVYREQTRAVQARLEALVRDTLAEYERLRHIPAQREFAEAALPWCWSKALFDLRKGKTMDEVLRASRVDTLARALGIGGE